MKTKRQGVGKSILRGLYAIIPVAGDSKREWVRKIAFWVAFFVFVGSSYYLVDEMLLQPQKTKSETETIRNWFYGDEAGEDENTAEDNTVYPEGMNEAFRSLYRRNPDVRGWLKFATTGGDLFNGAVDNPVVQAADNDYYLDHDFLGEKDKAGSLFFDYRNDLSATGENRNLIIYGHNLNSGLMFSRFNLLAKPNLEYARRLTTLTLDTLYEQNTYKVFAVMIVNANQKEEPIFNYIRTKFSSDASFEKLIEQIRMRSLYDFGDVDVNAQDELLTLSTCSNKRETYMKDARTVIVARKLRENESATVDTSKTTLNEDVLMPKMWYIAQGKELPEAHKQ